MCSKANAVECYNFEDQTIKESGISMKQVQKIRRNDDSSNIDFYESLQQFQVVLAFCFIQLI